MCVQVLKLWPSLGSFVQDVVEGLRPSCVGPSCRSGMHGVCPVQQALAALLLDESTASSKKAATVEKTQTPWAQPECHMVDKILLARACVLVVISFQYTSDSAVPSMCFKFERARAPRPA